MLASAISRIKYRNPPTIQKVIDHLREDVGINFLALDFDQTILDIHTGGNWKGSQEELFPHIRPVYADLIRAALTNKMEVAVVTFTCQIRFARGVLDHIFSACLLDGSMDAETLEAMGIMGTGNTVDTSQRIPIRGSDRSWRYTGGGSTEGKQPHIASAVEELETRREEDYQRARAVADALGNRSGGNVTPPPPGEGDGAKTPPPRPADGSGEQNEKATTTATTTTATTTTTSTTTTKTTTTTTPSTATIEPPEPITRKTTLLLDDDGRNIRHALNNKVRAIWFNPKKPHRLLPDLMMLE